MMLAYVFFFVIAFVWSVFLFLEGFDFGVGILTRTLGRSDDERRRIIRAIGPNWDANEVWLLTGGILIFAAFPAWYAAAFPSAYIPLLLVIFALIIRALAIEYRSRRPDHRWTGTWDNANLVAGILLPLLIGVFWAGMVHGIPIDADGRFVGLTLWSHISAYSLLGGVALVAFSVGHGAIFLAQKMTGELAKRAQRVAAPASLITFLVMVTFSLWTWLAYSDDAAGLAAAIVAIAAFALAVVLVFSGRILAAFWANGLGVCAFMAQIFIALYPNVLPTTLVDGLTLTIEGAAASSTALTLLGIIALIGIPGVLVYQGWSFWVFRGRITKEVADQAHY
jgi:cytochrome bd ubiquinol oxidase subunit II